MVVTLPDVLAVEELRAGNAIRQIGERGLERDGALGTFARGRLRGFLFQPAGGGQVLIIPKTKQIPEGHPRVVQASLDATMGMTLGISVIAFTLVYFAFLAERMSIELDRQRRMLEARA